MKHLCILLIRIYQWAVAPIKRWFSGGKGSCRYDPSCSQFAIRALEIHGFFKGSSLATLRILRCHPWGGYGLDRVPSRIPWRHILGFALTPDAWRAHARTTGGTVLVNLRGRFVAEGKTPEEALNSAQQGSRDFDQGAMYTSRHCDPDTKEVLDGHSVAIEIIGNDLDS
ncbi:MAG: membrane protein insertion efficiency factor YidD [Verrucomicrobiales bacterium]